jgi:hypothetical protein
MFFVEGGRLKALLNDRGNGLVAFVCLPLDVDVLEGLDTALASKGTDWRAARKSTPRK